jgi:hypothetical protein
MGACGLESTRSQGTGGAGLLEGRLEAGGRAQGLKALGLGQCQTCSYASQLKYADLMVEGRLLLWASDKGNPPLVGNWRGSG